MYLEKQFLIKGGISVSEAKTRKNMVWQSFQSHLGEIKDLQDKLCRVTAEQEALQGEIQAKKKFLEELTGLPWQEIQAALIDKSRSQRSDSQLKSAVAPEKQVHSKSVGTRVRVLRAIAHYEDHNRDSHINERSIKIYIDAQSPGFFQGHRDNIIHCALAYLCQKGLIVKTKEKSALVSQSQYNLTPAGRQMLTQKAGEEVSHAD